MAPNIEKINENDFVNKKIEKMKEEILEESYNEIKKSKKREKPLFIEKKDVAKFFPIFGIILIIIAVLAIYTINYLPWMYIKYNDSNLAEVDCYFYRDFKTKIEHKEILDIMGSKCDNCSSNSQNYIGLAPEDFVHSPQYIYYGFLALILLAIISTIFIIIDRYHTLSNRSNILFYSISGVAEIIIGVIILSLCAKFLGANLLLIYNKPLIENFGLNNVGMLTLAPIILMIFSFIIIKVAMIKVDTNLKKFEKKDKLNKTSGLFTAYRYGSNL